MKIFALTTPRLLPAAAVAALTVLGSLGIAAPAHAHDTFAFGYADGRSGLRFGLADDRDDHERRERWERREHWRRHHEAPPVFYYYAPPYRYAPPSYYYAPPPPRPYYYYGY